VQFSGKDGAVGVQITIASALSLCFLICRMEIISSHLMSLCEDNVKLNK
jgi:hypothetical protein